MAERREYAVDGRGERVIDNRKERRTDAEERAVDSQLESWPDDAAKQSADRQMERPAGTVMEQTDNERGRSSRDRDMDSRVERISEKLMENIVETAVADTKWADVGVKEAKVSESKGKKTARGRKKEQQLAERLAEKAVERNVEAAAERAAEKLAAEAGETAAEQKEDKQMSALSKEVLIREILEEFLA